MLSSFYKNSNLFKFTAKSTKSRSDYRGIHSSTPPNDGNDSPDWVQEFRLSGIPDRLTLANVAWIDGPEAVQILTEEAIARCQKVSSYLTKPAQEILNRYEFAEAGGWVVEGTTLTGDRGAVPYFKPDRPR